MSMKLIVADLKAIAFEILALNTKGIENWVAKYAKNLGLKVIDVIFDTDSFKVRLKTIDSGDAFDFGQSLLMMGKKFGFKGDPDLDKGPNYIDVVFNL